MLEDLPEAIGECTSLRALSLKGNQLRRLPDSFTKLQDLSILHLNENLFLEVPQCKYKFDCKVTNFWSSSLQIKFSH